jgi:hypothetical protein
LRRVAEDNGKLGFDNRPVRERLPHGKQKLLFIVACYGACARGGLVADG